MSVSRIGRIPDYTRQFVYKTFIVLCKKVELARIPDYSEVGLPRFHCTCYIEYVYINIIIILYAFKLHYRKIHACK